MLPTHFFVAYNDSKLAKRTIEELTFSLCHYYFNWAGPIKVPAPVMYAHKIAELFMYLKEEESNARISQQRVKAGNRALIAHGKENEDPEKYSCHKFNRDMVESLHFL